MEGQGGGAAGAYNHCILSAKVETDDTVREGQLLVVWSIGRMLQGWDTYDIFYVRSVWNFVDVLCCGYED